MSLTLFSCSCLCCCCYCYYYCPVQHTHSHAHMLMSIYLKIKAQHCTLIGITINFCDLNFILFSLMGDINLWIFLFYKTRVKMFLYNLPNYMVFSLTPLFCSFFNFACHQNMLVEKFYIFSKKHRN